ncbi:winged helix-turn-helix domain-containing protein [Paeniglutamicibacter antarcticus]|uniref:winged helix-turn-helix domain-containing protein n=1 Tax=Paeniglutamicibacter antarcticus TaxID=494023 RepID=UPI0031EAAD63
MAIAAQGLNQVRPTAPITMGAVGRTFARLELIQIDSVNVLARAQYLPIFSRLGPYDPGLLDALAVRKPRRVVEYWAHEASLVRSEHFNDLVPWQRRSWPGSMETIDEYERDLAQRILGLLLDDKPRTSREIAAELGHDEPKSNDGWGWNWSAAKRSLEALFAEGMISSEGRNSAFERRYTSLRSVLPKPAAPANAHERRQGMDRLLLAAAKAHGIGTAHCLADYFRLPLRQSSAALVELCEHGALEKVQVAGLSDPFYSLPGTVVPRRSHARALLGPFDSMVFNRRRIEKLFGFTYRLEIYTPAAKRVHGYYVLPFLLGEDLVARVDLKAERSSGRLLVRGAFVEPGAPEETAVELADELWAMARWLGLFEVSVSANGNLAEALEFSLSSPEIC